MIRRLALLLPLALALAPARGYTQVITFKKGAGTIATQLSHSARVHVDAMRRGLNYYRDVIGPDLSVLTNDSSYMNQLRAKVRASTIADIEYTTRGGQVIRIHARSGWSIRSTLGNIRGTGGSVGATSPDITFWEAVDDVNEEIIYPRDTPGEIWARNATKDPEWVVEPTRLPGQSTFVHKRDAELKALRKLEAWIEGAPATRSGGRLVAYVSQTVCPSCTEAFTTLAKTYGINGEVYALDESQPEADASRRANEERASRTRDRNAVKKRLDSARNRRAGLERAAQDAETTLATLEESGTEAYLVEAREAAASARASADEAASVVESEEAALARAESALADAEVAVASAEAEALASKAASAANMFLEDTDMASRASSRWLWDHRDDVTRELLPTGTEAERPAIRWVDETAQEGYRFGASAHSHLRESCGD